MKRMRWAAVVEPEARGGAALGPVAAHGGEFDERPKPGSAAPGQPGIEARSPQRTSRTNSSRRAWSMRSATTRSMIGLTVSCPGRP